MPFLIGQAKARRYTVLEHLQSNHAVARVNALGLVMTVPMGFSMVVVGDGFLIAPGAPEHPHRNRNDEHRRCKLKVGLSCLGIEVTPEIQPSKGNKPNDGGVRQGRRQTEQYRLRHCSANRDDERRHHRFGMTGFKAMKRSEKNCTRNEEPGVAVLQQVCEISHDDGTPNALVNSLP